MRYRFANSELLWQAKTLLLTEDNFSVLFTSVRNTDPDFFYYETAMPSDIIKNARQIKYAGGYELFQTECGIFHMNHWAMCRYAFGFYIDDLDGDTPIYVNPEILNQQTMIASHFLSTIGVHRKLLNRNCPILHASYVVHDSEAILFLGASGTGKSTQAQLWQDVLGAQIINGDRVLLECIGGKWTAHGYPCCGSSYICINQSAPIKAIVLLQQAAENRVEVSSVAKNICALTSATEIYPFADAEVSKAFDLAQKISANIPILTLRCTPDERAVMVLKDYLENVL